VVQRPRHVHGRLRKEARLTRRAPTANADGHALKLQTDRGSFDEDAMGRALQFLIAVSIVAFVVAAHLYPGGTHFDHATVGHRFWTNNLCDLARGTSIGGAPNAAGAVFARFALSALAVAVAVFFGIVANGIHERRLAIALRLLGLAAVPPAITVAFLPTDRFSNAHAVAIVCAGVPGLAGGLLAVVVHARRPRRMLFALGSATMALAATDFVIYVHESVTHGPPQLAIPILEKLALLAMIGWMVATARQSIPCSRSLL
jgi:hypothetical protein